MKKNNSSFLKNNYFKLGIGLTSILLSGKALSFLWKILLLQKNVELVGQIEVFLTSLGLVTAFCTMALPSAFSRFSLLTPKKTHAYLIFSLFQSVKLLGLLSIFSILFSFFFPYLSAQVYVVSLGLFLFTLFFSTFNEFLLVFLNIQKKFTLYGLGRYFWMPFLKILGLILIFQHILSENFLFVHVVWASIGAVFFTLISLLYQGKLFSLSFLKKNKKRYSLSNLEKKKFLSYSFLLSGSFITYMIYGSLDIYLIRYFMGNFTVGVYAAFFMGVNVLELLFSPFLQTFQIHLAERKKVQEKKTFTRKTALTLFTVGMFLAFFFSFILLFLMRNFISVNASSLIMILTFLVAKVIQSSFVHILRMYLDYQGEQIFTLKTMSTSLGIKVIIGVIATYKWGLLGLALTQYITEHIHSVLLWRKIFLPKKKNLQKVTIPKLS